MPVNDPKNVKPEDLLNAAFSALFGEAPSGSKPKSDAPAVDNLSEAMRLLKKTEGVVTGKEEEASVLLQIASLHLRVVDTALAYQK